LAVTGAGRIFVDAAAMLNGDGALAIDEPMRAVGDALHGC
jgi:hypothetical protein